MWHGMPPNRYIFCILVLGMGEKYRFFIHELGYVKHGQYMDASPRRLLKAVEEGYEPWVVINKNSTMFGTITDDLYRLPLRAVEVVG